MFLFQLTPIKTKKNLNIKFQAASKDKSIELQSLEQANKIKES